MHKHLTDAEILEYIKKNGKIKEIDRRILECSVCFGRFKHIYYREQFLKEQARSRRKDFFKNILENFKKGFQNFKI